ncbi:MAG TPA: sugar transferase [Aestuariivirgaceae bacterium]|nr:sugar transferase [Aestuariivirgaceae bacterium]
MDTRLRMAAPQRVVAPAQRQRTRWSLDLLARNRYQLIGVAIVAILLPALLSGAGQRAGTGEASVIASVLAVLLGAYMLRRLTAFPGVQRHAFVFPVFLAAYAAIVVAFAVLRLDYSRLQLGESFLAAVLWFHFVLHVERPVRRPRLLVLRGGNAEDLLDLDGADWMFASSPDDVPGEVTGVVADLRSALEPEWEKFLARCALNGLPLYHSKEIRESLTGYVAIEHLSENTLGTFLPSSLYMRFKRLLDLAGVLISAPVTLPVALLTALLVKLVDGGPVLFRQTRMGFRGQPFAIYKFRTMAVGAETAGLGFTEENDDRISRLGWVLRRYRLDELPQILNILRGEMSWIGPRPESITLADWYERHIPFYSYRHIVRPGITGWAQVNQGNVAMIKAATTKLHYDFYYIKHVSFWIELLIAARTVRIVLSGFGAR